MAWQKPSDEPFNPKVSFLIFGLLMEFYPLRFRLQIRYQNLILRQHYFSRWNHVTILVTMLLLEEVPIIFFPCYYLIDFTFAHLPSQLGKKHRIPGPHCFIFMCHCVASRMMTGPLAMHATLVPTNMSTIHGNLMTGMSQGEYVVTTVQYYSVPNQFALRN